MANGTAAFTKDKLKKMEASGRVPVNLDRDQDATEDNYGFTAARGSNSAQLKRGGAAKPHMGRPGRASGGKVVHDRDMNKASTEVTHLPDLPKLRARGGRAEHSDEAEDRALVKKMVKPEARMDRGGRTHNDEHRHHRARGGRAGRGKTVVNVIVGRGGQPQGAAPMPPPMPPPMAPPPPPMPPPRPPMAGPPMPMPSGGAPMGPMGAPPGGMPMRARGGKIPSPKDGGNGGLGRLEKAKEEGARY